MNAIALVLALSLAPTFSLVDQNGETVTLESLLEKGRTALLFYRSADW